MDLGIRDRVALVTGASAGIGAAVATALAAEGVRLALAARRTAELERVASSATAAGAIDARVFSYDQTQRGSGAALVTAVTAAMGAPAIVVVNGGGPRPGRYTDVAENDWDAAYDRTLRSAIELTDAVIGPMRAAKWGRIVALASTSVKQPIPTLVLSNAFRTGLVAAFKTLALEVAADGVTVNTIATGRVDTDRFRAIYGTMPGGVERAHAEVPIGHAATPAEFAPLVAFLCGEPARYVTGQTIAIDGGLVAGLFG